MRNDPLATGRSIFLILFHSVGFFIYYFNEHIVFHIANMFFCGLNYNSPGWCADDQSAVVLAHRSFTDSIYFYFIVY